MSVQTEQLPHGVRRSWWPVLTVATMLGLGFGWIALSYLKRFSLSAPASVSVYASFLLLLFLALAPGTEASRDWVAQFRGRGRLRAFVLLPCVPYLIYAVGTGDFRIFAFGRLLLIAALPVLIYELLPVRKTERFNWQDASVATLLIAAVLSGGLRGVWNVPVNLDFMGRLFLIAVASWCWTFFRRVPGLGYSLHISNRVIRAAALNFLYFAAFAVPAGLLIGFTGWHPKWHGTLHFLIDYLEIFLFIALLEEMFFRGFLQSLLTASMGSVLKAQAAVSLSFGLFHILHAPFPNWRYVALASVAGWFYGSAFRAGGSITASALTHAMVDTVWRTWFTH